MRYQDAVPHQNLKQFIRVGTEESINDMFLLLDDNRKRFAEILGPRSQTFTGSGARYDVWHVERDGLSFWILTGVPGTSYEVTCSRDDLKRYTKEIEEFLDHVLGELKSLS